MKKILVVFALFAALIFVVSCGGGSKTGDKTDSGEVVNDEDGDTADSGSTDNPDSDNPDTAPDNPDSDDTNTNPDAGDSAPDNGDTTPDGGDSQPDDGDTEPDNDYPQTPCDPNPCLSDANSTGVCTINNNSYVCGCIDGYIFDGTLCIKSLPECSPSSDTPCLDSVTGLIWSAKSGNKMPWNDALNYCQNLTEGDFNNWRLPSIAVLKTLVQNCSSAKCSDDYTGIYSKFGDTVYLWTSSEGEDSTALSIYFSDASTQPVSIDTNVNVRCVRRESESRETNCTGLIENSVWNTATKITQTWDWETAAWTPSPEGIYNAEGSSSECRFKCDSNSFREGSKCLNPCKPNPCNSIGETGTCLSKSANEYRCECEENYFWNGSSHCLNPCEPNPCTGIGETGTCIGKSANEYSCECENNYVWNPYSQECMKNPCNIPNSTGTCNPVSKTQYTCECEEKYFFDSDSGKCLNPCESNPCNAVAHSSHICTASSLHQYSCECEENYYWWGKEKGCQDTRPTLGNICTNQTSCYNASSSMTCPTSSSADFYGQDAQYTDKCTAQSFTSSTNVVIDNNTGLTWEKSPSSDTYTWANANDHCAELNSSNYGGKKNWRVPNPLEFMTIVDNSRYNPATNSNFTGMPTSDRTYLWTSKEYKGNTSYAYVFMPWYGDYYVNDDFDSFSYKVLCVSGNEMQPAISADFTSQTISGKVVVTDSKTGLMWQKEYAINKTWTQALKYCEKLTYAGYSDWRLPNKNELSSLINYEKSGAPYSYFPDMPSELFWSSSTFSDFTDYAWFVDFSSGGVDGYGKTYGNGYVRCVR